MVAFCLFSGTYNMKTAEIDLHGLDVKWAMKVLSGWIKGKPLPFRIITGNGCGVMSRLTRDLLSSGGYVYQYESDWNLGTLVVYDRKKFPKV